MPLRFEDDARDLGLSVGLVAAFFLANLLPSFLFGVEPRDTAAFEAQAAMMLVGAVIGIALLGPARRAAAVPPAIATRSA